MEIATDFFCHLDNHEFKVIIIYKYRRISNKKNERRKYNTQAVKPEGIEGGKEKKKQNVSHCSSNTGPVHHSRETLAAGPPRTIFSRINLH